MNAEELFQAALAKVDSEKIREWANSAHNRPLWIRAANAAILKHNGQPDVSFFAGWIVAEAIGL